MSKTKLASSKCEGVHSIQLDSIKVESHKQLVLSYLSSLNRNGNKTTCLFASPEVLLKWPWASLIDNTMHKQTLTFVCADEVHLYVNFALSFRKSFLLLKTILFDKLKINDTLKIPIIVMTATFNNQLLHLLSEITSCEFLDQNKCWSEATEFSRRNIVIDISMSSQRYHTMKKILIRSLKRDLKKKAIIYSNVADSVEKIETKLIDG